MKNTKPASKSRKTTKSSAAPKTNSKRLPSELLQLEEIVGGFIEYWGFKKIHGRIWVHLFTSEKPLSSQELMARVKVSKGMMSIAVRDLIEYDVIQESFTGPHGTTFYQANSDLMGVISNVLRTRESAMLGAALITAQSLLKLKDNDLREAGISSERVGAVVALTSSAHTLLSTFLTKGGSEKGALFDPLI